ncbi:MAG: type IV pilus assembly protein PilM [Candidatus Nealsonbacteria bacterium]|nr:type IV pilus assembly protein PilM [Candidatus Nealsonbacteria bacterium]
MLDFLTLRQKAFGLDISDLSLKIVNLKKNGGKFKMVSHGEKDIAPGVIREGRIVEQEKLVSLIEETLQEVKGEKLSSNYVVASLPEERAFFKVIQMPKIQEGDLRSAVIYEAENYIPMPIEQVYLDFQVVPPLQGELDHLDVLIGAVPKEMVDPYLFALKEAGLEPKALEVESLAITRALIKDEISPSPVLLIDFGATRTSFIIFSGHALRFTTSISVSSASFTEIIAKNLGVPLKEAEELKKKYGLEEKIKLKMDREETDLRKKRSKIFEILMPALIDLAQQIDKHLHYYQTHSSHEHLPPDNQGVSKILLCGGGSNLKGLPEFLEQKINIPVELGNPWVNILTEEEKPTMPLSKSMAYTTALGLALRGAKKENSDYD